MGQDVLIAAIRVGADRGPSRLIEPRAEVVAKALPCQLQAVALLGLEILERGERASAGVGIPDLPGGPTKIHARPLAPDRQLGHPRSGLPAAIDAAFAPWPLLPGHASHCRSTTHRSPRDGRATAVRASWLGLRPAGRRDARSRDGCRAAAPSPPADMPA